MSTGSKRTILDNRHPEYAKLAPEWLFWKQAYEGGPDYRSAGHLFRFPRESKKSYDERLKRAGRMNFVKQVLDLIMQYLSKEAPSRKKDIASAAIQGFWEDADRQGTSIDDFMHAVGVNAGIFGRYYIVIDKPPELAVNKLDQTQRKLNPYAYGVSPLDVLDVIYGADGTIEQALIREYVRGPIDLLEPRDSDELQERYRIWIKTFGEVFWVLCKLDEKGEVVKLEQGYLPIPRVPIIEVRRTGGSLIDDIATLDRTVYNYGSLLDQILYDQTFSTLRLPYSGTFEEFYDKWELTIGTKSIIPFDAEIGAAPDYISPDASQGTLLVEAIEKAIGKIYQCKNLQDTVGNAQQGKPAAAASGIAKGYDFEKLNAGLAQYADDLEKAEEGLVELVNLWEGITEPIAPDLIDYQDSFDVKTLMQELTEYTLLAQNVQSATFKKLQQKKIVKKADPKMEPADYDIVMAEIDASQDPAEIAAQQAKQAGRLRGA
jgi:hypothetical protein